MHSLRTPNTSSHHLNKTEKTLIFFLVYIYFWFLIITELYFNIAANQAYKKLRARTDPFAEMLEYQKLLPQWPQKP